jgi:excisionase family DNA binding protein
MSDILTKDEVAAMLDCEPSTVEEKARTRELPGVKIGRSWIFPREALMKRLNEIALRAATDPAPPRYSVAARPNRRAPPALPSL